VVHALSLNLIAPQHERNVRSVHKVKYRPVYSCSDVNLSLLSLLRAVSIENFTYIGVFKEMHAKKSKYIKQQF